MPATATHEAEELRGLVATGCQVLGQADQGDYIWGHVSARDPEGRGVWMKANGLGFEEVGADDVILVGWDGEVLEGDRRRHAEYPIHTEAVRARPDVGAVVHTHSQAAVTLGALGVPLRPISHEGSLFVPPDLARFTETGDLVLTADLGRKVAAALGDRNACLLVNHGVVTVGPDVPTAVMTALLLDRACATQLLAMSAGGAAAMSSTTGAAPAAPPAGGRVRWSPPDEALAKREHCYGPALIQGAWDYLVRRLSRSTA